MDDLINKGNRHFIDGKIQLALDLYNQYNVENKPTAETYMKIGHCYKSLLDLETAVEFYQKSVKLQPDSYETLYNYGDTYIQLGQLENAIDILDKAIEVTEKKGGPVLKFAKAKRNEALSALLNRKGANLLYENRLEEAYETFLQAIELNSLDKSNYFKVGVIFLRQGNFESSIDWFKKALKIDPNDIKCYFNIGTIYLKNTWYQQAINLYLKALELNLEGKESNVIKMNLEAAQIGLEDAKIEFIEFLSSKKRPNNNEYYTRLANNVCDEKIATVDIIYLESGKLEIGAYGDKSKYLILENDGILEIKKVL
jgi:tetratricopeptide (TPR) repeat protein